VNKIPPVQNTENHAQTPEIGGTGDTGGIVDISVEEVEDLLQQHNRNNGSNVQTIIDK
jgi:hypothetical protein